jgi:dTDP-4-dehydrorhamnose reductase
LKILLTGANGQVGQAILARVHAYPEIELIACSRAELDISQPEAVMQIYDELKPDCVINAAAYTAVDKAEEDKEAAERINGAAPGYLAAECARRDIPLLHISTDFVFDGEKEKPYLESDPCDPLSVYGQSKLAGETAIAQSMDKFIILRTAWVFGGEANFVNTMRRLAESRDALSVVDDQVGGPTSAAQIADALLKIAQRVTEPNFANWGIYHFSGAPFVSWYEFATEILKDNPAVTVSSIPSSGYPTPAKRPANSRLNCDKIKNVFGIEQPDWRHDL